MDCPAEERLIRYRLEGMPGIEALRFNLMQRELTISHHLEDDAPVFAALQELRMDPQRQGGEGGAPAAPKSAVSTRTKWLVGLSGLAAIAAEIIGWTTDNEQSPLVITLSVFAIAFSGVDTVKKGITAIKTFTLNINFLMMIAVAGAMLIGKWPEAAAGKNPVTHVGKIYNIVAQRIAETLVTTVPQVSAAHCLMVSRIGAPVTRPAIIEVKLTTRDQYPVTQLRQRVEEITADALNGISGLINDFMAGNIEVF